MRILALECSASPASCCVYKDGVLSGEFFLNIKTTHSQVLLPMVESLLKTLSLTPKDIDIFAISFGPGSFTGLRIGISSVKGMAFGGEKNCLGVSTLLSMAYNFLDTDCIVCATMDARCKQVYNALFSVENGVVKRITEDRALMCSELYDEICSIRQLKNYSKSPIIVCGDGADMFFEFVKDINGVRLASDTRKFQHSSGVALCAAETLKTEEPISADELNALYLRLPQAERELKKKKGEI